MMNYWAKLSCAAAPAKAAFGRDKGAILHMYGKRPRKETII